jgi:hypothetical protein
MSIKRLIKFIKSKKYHKCERHQMYFEEEHSRGIFCGVCHNTLSEEVF